MQVIAVSEKASFWKQRDIKASLLAFDKIYIPQGQSEMDKLTLHLDLQTKRISVQDVEFLQSRGVVVQNPIKGESSEIVGNALTEILRYNAKMSGASVIVHFEPNIPYNSKNKMAVSMIIYELPWTPDNVASMKQAAIEKYGQPSNGTIGVSSHWCLQPHSNPGFGCSEFRGPKLVLSGTKLQLEDFRYRQAVIDYMNKSSSSKPAF